MLSSVVVNLLQNAFRFSPPHSTVTLGGGAEANNGRLYARNLPGKGCVFTVDLPRCPMAVAELL